MNTIACSPYARRRFLAGLAGLATLPLLPPPVRSAAADQSRLLEAELIARPALLLVLIHALLGPVLAVMTIIGSMGNGPLAAVLWENGVLFAGIMAFLYSDFVVIPSLRINASYYGWPFAAYLAAVFTGSAVGAALLVYALFSLIGLIPEPRAGQVQQLAQFEIDYAFFLGVGALVMTGGLLWLGRRKPERHRAPA